MDTLIYNTINPSIGDNSTSCAPSQITDDENHLTATSITQTINYPDNIPETFDTAERIVGGKKYIVRSIFLGNNDKTINEILLDIAERKTIREMGLS